MAHLNYESPLNFRSPMGFSFYLSIISECARGGGGGSGCG